jgi:uncharacterized membrane protein (UPF0127 family)
MFGPSRMLVIALALALCACRTASSTESQPDTSQTHALAAPTPATKTPPRVTLAPPGGESVTVDVEVVDTPESRQRGLMFRKQLAPEAGMLFLFERPEQHTFWMHNTLVPLDMIFITADWSVLGIVENATPLTDAPRGVPGESQYVLEVNAGFSRRHALAAGTSVQYAPGSDGS